MQPAPCLLTLKFENLILVNQLLTFEIMAEDNVAGWSMSRQSADRAPDITIQLNLLTISGYLKLCVLAQR